MKRIVNALGKLGWEKRAYAVFLLCAATAITLSAQITTLFTFDGTHGASPYAELVQATNGDLYGTTWGGGAKNAGTVFKINPAGTLTTLYSFCSQANCTDGVEPEAGLFQAANGDLYGTTFYGGSYNHGTVFRITPTGTLTTLYSFCSQSGCPDGSGPGAGLVQAANGDLYGTTYYGGGNFPGAGTVFKITPTGTRTTVYIFCSQGSYPICPDGALPNPWLSQATDGDLYGTAYEGGATNNGTVFRITPTGTLTTLYSFCPQSQCRDGSAPRAGLVQGANGDFYGTTAGDVFPYNLGTVFKITPSGTLTTLYRFCPPSGCPDGASPGSSPSGLVQAADGDFYGTTYSGGANGLNTGTVFKITPAGMLTTLYSFCSQGTYPNCADGFAPWAGVVQDTNGDFYGTTLNGGAYNEGTVFRLSVGLGPFVKMRPPFGEVGAAVKILGTNLTGATSVTFNGTVAVFYVVSGSEITTTVPAGATSGRLQVVTPSGTLSSIAVFRVMP